MGMEEEIYVVEVNESTISEHKRAIVLGKAIDGIDLSPDEQRILEELSREADGVREGDPEGWYGE